MTDDYPIFAKWLQLLDWILDRIEKYPKSVRFTIGNRTANLALDALDCIITAIYTKDRSHILQELNLYIEKLRVMFRIGMQRRYLSMKQYEYISAELLEVGKMVGGWKKHAQSR